MCFAVFFCAVRIPLCRFLLFFYRQWKKLCLKIKKIAFKNFSFYNILCYNKNDFQNIVFFKLRDRSVPSGTPR